MPQPAPSDYIDPVLTNVAVSYRNAADSFIARQVFPTIPVPTQTGRYYIFDKNSWFQDSMRKRPPATESVGSGYTVSSSQYFCDVWALHKDVDDQTRANLRGRLDPDRNATAWLTQMSLLRLEIQWVSDFFTPGVWNGGVDLTGVSGVPGANQFKQWSDYAASDPVNDIEEGKERIVSVTGLMPNVLVLGYQVRRKLVNHPDLIDRFKYTTSEAITEQILARMFGVDRVLTAQAVKATNVEGETAAYSFVHGKSALLMHVASTAAPDIPSAGYTFEWEGVSDGLGETVGISTIPMPTLRADRIEIQSAFDNKVVSSDLGIFYNTVVA